MGCVRGLLGLAPGPFPENNCSSLSFITGLLKHLIAEWGRYSTYPDHAAVP